jgi:predicted transcriptional regulator
MPTIPRIDELLEAIVNGYEDVIRRSCELQRTLARGVPFDPVRSLLNTTADLTRDIAAVQLSGARWLLDS